jgi:hypothetical protein
MVNEIVLGILDPLPLDSTSKVETFHPHGCSLFCCPSMLRGELTAVTSVCGDRGEPALQETALDVVPNEHQCLSIFFGRFGVSPKLSEQVGPSRRDVVVPAKC